MITIQCEIICEWCYAPGTLMKYESKGWEVHRKCFICPQCLYWWRHTRTGSIADVKSGINAVVPDPRNQSTIRFDKFDKLDQKVYQLQMKFELLDNNLGSDVHSLKTNVADHEKQIYNLATSIKDLEGRIEACGAWQNQISRDLSETTSVVCRHGSVMDSLDKFIKRAEKHDAEVDNRLLALEGKKGATAFKSAHRIGDRYIGKVSRNPYIIVQGRDGNLTLYSASHDRYYPLDELNSNDYELVNNVFDI